MNSIKVVIFDDNASFRDSVAMLLQDAKEFTLIDSYAHCLDVLDNIKETHPHVVLMDIDMPGMNGIEGVRLIHNNFPSVQILMLTVFDDSEKVFAALQAGASGYILKNAQPKNLLNAISEVYSGGAPMTPAIAKKVLNRFQQLQHNETKEDYNLTARESEVLSLLVEGLSYKMIASKLDITYDTVRAHMKKIYEKLHVTSMTEAVAKAINKKLFSVL
ncbi:response regulator transcription factor [Panacibacter ginsenosidivorans]|uniref:Response regulator transcription factor n=1 Tax=Panacibacter ginsenosidivorans TaxID=1813871 RepID=A0A5B8V8B8_9BACT|nr:response regulator transcription factor [Panacibacter ginsenosidivorans]QEC66618.1 response regulator transcription factor [Panacibacter ginsenosidivorans]